MRRDRPGREFRLRGQSTSRTALACSSPPCSTIPSRSARAPPGGLSSFGCRDLARVDFFLDRKDGAPRQRAQHLPGFTSISMYPKLWEHAGLALPELLARIVRLATERRESQMRARAARLPPRKIGQPSSRSSRRGGSAATLAKMGEDGLDAAERASPNDREHGIEVGVGPVFDRVRDSPAGVADPGVHRAELVEGGRRSPPARCDRGGTTRSYGATAALTRLSAPRRIPYPFGKAAKHLR
jgi:hypothetical protein